MSNKITPGQIVIWLGMVLGNLETLICLLYAAFVPFASNGYMKAFMVFFIGQPLWYFFIFALYMATQGDRIAAGKRCCYIGNAFVYFLVMWTKLLAGSERFHRWALLRMSVDETEFQLMSLESCFRVQTAVELFVHTVPMIIVQAANNNAGDDGWTGIAKVSMLVLAFMLIKNLSLVTIFVIRKSIDGLIDPDMRPETTHRKASRIELEAFNHIQSYLIDPHDDGVDENGNTTVHQLMRYEPDCTYFSDQLSDFPHHLFMLNKYGQTPLDIAIQETIEAVDLEA